MILEKGFISFFKELSKNNSKEWFDANRKRYENEIKKPFYQLIDDVIVALNKYERIDIKPKDAVFRINRDIRFSKDKTPYKTHVAAVVSSRGRKEWDFPGIYFHIGAEEVIVAGGAYQLSKELLLNMRYELAENPAKIDEIISDKGFAKYFDGIEGEKNKIIPKEFKPFLEKQPLIANKQYYCYRKYSPDELIKKRVDLVDFFVEHYKAMKPLNDYLIKIIYQ